MHLSSEKAVATFYAVNKIARAGKVLTDWLEM